MTWILRYHGATVARGSYSHMLDTAEELRVLDRSYHVDGTELPPRWSERGWAIVPAASGAARRCAA